MHFTSQLVLLLILVSLDNDHHLVGPDSPVVIPLFYNSLMLLYCHLLGNSCQRRMKVTDKTLEELTCLKE